MSLLQSFIITSGIEILACTETWLSPYVFNEEFLPPGYSVFRHDRDGRGGGVLLAIRNHIPCFELSSPKDLELVTVNIGLVHQVTLCVLYRPPNASHDYNVSLSNYLNCLAMSPGRIVILGDFNVPDIDWDTLSGDSPFSLYLCDFVFNNNFTQLVHSLTHIKGDILDLVLSSDCFLINCISISKSMPLSSDHYAVFFRLCCSSPRYSRTSLNRPVYNYAKADWEGLVDYLLEFDFSQCFSDSDIDTVWSCFKDILLSSVERFIPRVKKRSLSYHSVPWLRGDLQHNLNQIRTLRRRYARNPTDHIKMKLANEEAEFTTAFCDAKSKYEERLVKEHGHDQSKIYRYVRHISKSREIPESLSIWSRECF
ncbi:PREDICTED: uncharacterized protein LOC105315277 [Amphimedon queenslandica]|nr:PREDICTED: uncharacterized protein LOC105315277 [Amphimedon queenslandica]|eukprot:XP_011408163.1 PREDICTED: uncharacterized protein LOC105315277 [Amphimedon queenslandica]